MYKQRKVIDNIKNLFQKFDYEVKSINDEIWSKIAKTTVAYYSPERVFIYTNFSQKSIRFEIFTRGEDIEGVKNYDRSKGLAKWGVINLNNINDLNKVIEVVKISYLHIKEAIKNNEPTGWYAKIEEESDEDK